MFIKLTRLDNTPIWLNASFIVTVEPRKGGGTIVVPVGDGLDYEVREKAETVLEMLADAPAPTVVPVPSSDCLTQTPDDVSPEPERSEPEVALRENPVASPAGDAVPQPAEPAAPEEVVEKPVRKTTRKTAVKKTATAKPRKRTTKKAVADEEVKSEPQPEPPPAEPAQPEPQPTEPKSAEPDLPLPVLERPAVELNENQIDRLRRMMPRSVRKLANTLMAQFKIVDTLPTIRALAERGVLRLDNDRVIWIG